MLTLIRAGLVLVLLMYAVPVLAQTPTPVTVTSRVVFTPSIDHAAVDSFSREIVTHYELEVIGQNGLGAIAFTKGLGKPAPNPQGEIDVVVQEFGGLVVDAVHKAAVSAVGPGGMGRSALSNPFGRPGPVRTPTAPTNLTVVS